MKIKTSKQKLHTKTSSRFLYILETHETMAAQSAPLTFYVPNKRSQRRTPARNHRRSQDRKSLEDVATIQFKTGRKSVSHKDKEWQKKHSRSAKAGATIASSNGRFAALADDSDDESKVSKTQTFPPVVINTMSALPYGAMIRRTMKKSETGETPKPVCAPTIFDQMDALDAWADEVEANPSDAVVETPEWARKMEDQNTTVKRVKFGDNITMEFNNTNEDRLARGGH